MQRIDAEKWLQDNVTMYRGDNASDCMIAAFLAGGEKYRSALAKIIEIAEHSECDCGVPCDCSSGSIFHAGRIAKDALA